MTHELWILGLWYLLIVVPLSIALFLGVWLTFFWAIKKIGLPTLNLEVTLKNPPPTTGPQVSNTETPPPPHSTLPDERKLIRAIRQKMTDEKYMPKA